MIEALLKKKINKQDDKKEISREFQKASRLKVITYHAFQQYAFNLSSNHRKSRQITFRRNTTSNWVQYFLFWSKSMYLLKTDGPR